MRHINKGSPAIILLNLLGLAAVVFLGRQLANDANRVIAIHQELYTTARGKEGLAFAAKTLAETTESRAIVAGAFLRGSELISFIEKLESLAKTAGVDFNLDEPKSLAGKTGGLHLTFSATGSFTGLYRFLALLENLPYRIDWNSLDWSQKSGTTWSGIFDLTVASYVDDNVTD